MLLHRLFNNIVICIEVTSTLNITVYKNAFTLQSIFTLFIFIYLGNNMVYLLVEIFENKIPQMA